MTKNEILEKLKSSEYEFLKSDKHLGNNIILLTLSGSYGYGTNVEGSDIDLRGITSESPEELIGLNSFDEFRNDESDVCILSFNKFIKCLLQSNPNVIEFLGCKEYLYVSDLGKEILNNKNIFLSTRIASTIEGYITSQLHRLKSGTLQLSASTSDVNKTIVNSMTKTVDSFNKNRSKLQSEYGIKIKEQTIGEESKLLFDFSCSDVDFNSMLSLCQQMLAIKRDYNVILSSKKSIPYPEKFNKWMMHIIRLYHMGTEILETGKINTYRESDHDLLMSIRNGKYFDGKLISQEFFNLVDECEQKLKTAKENTLLPDSADMNKINNFVVSTNKKIINGEIKNNFIGEFYG